MMRRLLNILALLAVIGAVAFWALTIPQTLDAADMPTREGDAANGAVVFAIGGCASCHAAPGAEGEARLVLSGGKRFETPFGVFLAPNISPHAERGLGAWSALDLANALVLGVSPEGAHYYPALPYVSYARMSLDDVVDLKAYLDTLPISAAPSAPHEVGFPFNIRRGLGLWKLLYFDADPAPIAAIDDPSPAEERGRYLVEGPGHCGECHTPRDGLGGLDDSKWLTGAPSPDGDGRAKNITQGEGGIGGWSAADIAEYLRSGLTPDYDTSSGEMVDVIENTSRLPEADREAIAAYLKRVGADAEGS